MRVSMTSWQKDQGISARFIQDIELGGGQDGSRMIVVCESTLTHT